MDNRLTLSSPLLVSIAWKYTAFAAHKNVVIKGFVKDMPNEDLCLSTCDNIKAIAASDRLCLVLLENGKLFKIEPKFDNSLKEVRCIASQPVNKRNKFVEPTSAKNNKFTFIATGENITAAVDETNAVFSIPLQIYQLPRHVKVRQLECGFEHAMLLTSNGEIYCWGNGMRGQLGIEPMQMLEVPVLIEALMGIEITFIAAGGWHSAAISVFGHLYTWGFNTNGQLGLRIFKSLGLKAPAVYPLPQLIDLPDCCPCDLRNSSENVKCVPFKIFAGGRHTILQMSCGSLLVVGWNKYGQLSLPINKNLAQCDMFTKINYQSHARYTEVVCGAWNTFFILECGENKL